MAYAVEALQKIMGFPRTGDIGPAEALALASFQYPAPLQPDGEANRTEIDVTKQVLTLYENNQVRLITTTSTGSGAALLLQHAAGEPDPAHLRGREHAVGPLPYTRYVNGWDKSPLGQLYNPFYFNGGIAVHGYQDVPTGPGVARLRPHPDAHRGVLPHARARR